METRRILKSAAGISLAFILLFTLMPSRVMAWGNIEAHPEINRRALDLFSTRQQSDSYFKGISLNGEASWGLAWDQTDGNSLVAPKPGIKRQKNLDNWIIDGGYSADEPEGPMGMRHFYDPTNKTSPWLTDTDWIAGFLRRTLGSQATNPEISAVDWANNKDEGFAKMDVFLKQEYSFPDAKEYFKQALADKSRDNPAYGNAWRAVGETMHLVADMSLAPHVRNDGHGLGDGDPVEVSTTDASIGEFDSTNWTTSINYDQSVTGLMHDLAAYTNKNFFSKDTIPIAGKTTTANGQPAYPNPDISKLTVNKAGYLVSTIDGQTVRLARQSVWYRWGLSKNPGYTIDAAVITDQQRILAPTIVRASEAVIERFLPRFEVQATVKPDPDSAGKYIVRGSIIQSTNTEWKERLIIRNGAHVILKGSRETVKLFNNDDLNAFTHTISAQSGDEIKVVYDLGGYVIESPIIKALTTTTPAVAGNNLSALQQMKTFSGVFQGKCNVKERTSPVNFVVTMPERTSSTLNITWNGASFSGKVISGIEGDTHTSTVSGMVSGDGKTLTSLVFTYRRDSTYTLASGVNEGVNTIDLQFKNIPIADLVFGNGSSASSFDFNKYGPEVKSYLVKYEQHNITNLNGKLYSETTYLPDTIDWNGTSLQDTPTFVIHIRK